MSLSLTRLQSFYGELKTPLLLHAIIRREFRGTVALVTNFDLNAGALLATVAEIDPALPILFLNTGKHFPETLSYARTLTQHLGLADVRWLSPSAAELEQEDPQGILWKSAPEKCCALRKARPLQHAIEEGGFLAVITGRMNPALPAIGLDENGVFHINPLARSSKEEQNKVAAKHGLPPHPLEAGGYDSVGCDSCSLSATRWPWALGISGREDAEAQLPAAETNWSV